MFAGILEVMKTTGKSLQNETEKKLGYISLLGMFQQFQDSHSFFFSTENCC